MTGTAAPDAGIAYRVDAGLAHITLDRPRQRNAIDLPMRAALLAAIEDAARQPSVKAVVLSGAGEHFCGGGDTSSMGRSMRAEQGRERMLPIAACAKALLEMPKPVICAVDGVAYGGGFGLALCADWLVATPRARFCLPFMRIGLIPDFAVLHTLPRLIGVQRARQLIYTAGEIDGSTALDYGIVAELAAPAALQARAGELAQAMACMPPAAFAMTKQALLHAFSRDLASATEIETIAQGLAFDTEHHRQAVALLKSKQPLPYTFPAAPRPVADTEVRSAQPLAAGSADACDQSSPAARNARS